MTVTHIQDSPCFTNLCSTTISSPITLPIGSVNACTSEGQSGVFALGVFGVGVLGVVFGGGLYGGTGAELSYVLVISNLLGS